MQLESLHTERDKLQAEKVALIDTIKSLNRRYGGYLLCMLCAAPCLRRV